MAEFDLSNLPDQSEGFDLSSLPDDPSTLETAGKIAFWIFRPMLAPGAAALAPYAHDYESETFTGRIGESFEVAGEAFIRDLFPDFNDPRPNYAGQALQDINIPEELRPSAEIALSVITDPTVVVSGGFATLLRKSFELSAKTGETISPFTTALRESVSVVPMRPEEVRHFTTVAAKADHGDVKATQEILDAFIKKEADVVEDVKQVDIGSVHPKSAVEPEARLSDIENVVESMAKGNKETLKNAKELEDIDKIRLEARRNVIEKTQAERAMLEAKTLKSATKQAREMIDEHPVYRLMQAIKSSGGMSAEGLSDDVVLTLKENHPGIISKNGKPFIDVAAEHGFENAEIMVESLAKVGSKKAAVEEVAQSIFRFELQSAKEVSELDIQGRFLDEEIRLLKKRFPKERGIKQKIKKVTGQAKPLGRMISEERALKAAFKKAEQASRVAFREGSIQAKLASRDKFLAYKEAVQARQSARKAVKTIDRAVRHKSLPVDYMEQLQAVLGGIRNVPNRFKAQTPQHSFDEFLDLKIAEGEEVAAALLRSMHDELPSSRSINELTVEEIQRFESFAKAMTSIGLNEKKLLSLEREANFQETISDAVESIYSTLPVRFQTKDTRQLLESRQKFTPLDDLSDFARAYNATTLRPEFIAIALDGEKLDGKIQRLIRDPLQRANDAELLKLESATKRLDDAFKPFEKGRRGRVKWANEKKVFILENGKSWSITKMQQVMIALNNGNKGNRAALMRGYGLTEKDIGAITSSLSDKEAKLVDDVFDVVGSFWKESADVHLALTGQRLKRVEGRYFRIIQDWGLIRKAGGKDKFGERDLFSNINPQITPKTEGAQRIERRGGAGAPLLDFSAIGRQVENAIHDVTHAIPVRDIQKVIANKDFKNAVSDTLGAHAYDQLGKSLQHVARPVRENMGMLEKGLRWARSNATVAALGLRVSVGMKQVLSLSQTMKEIGSAPVIKEVAILWANPNEFRRVMRFVDELSPEIKFRNKTFDRDIGDFSLKFLPKNIREVWFSIIRLGDRMAVYPSYMAAYKKSMAETGGDIQKSRLFAQKIVRITQPINQAKDVSLIQRGSEFQRTTTMFFTFFSVARNQFARLGRQKRLGMSFAEFAKGYWFLLVMPAVVAEAINQRRLPTAGESVKAIAGFYAGTFPWVRDVYSLTTSDFDFNISPVFDQIERLQRPFVRPTTRNTLESLGFLSGIPTRQAMITVDGIEQLYEGNSDFILEPFLGPQKEKK